MPAPVQRRMAPGLILAKFMLLAVAVHNPVTGSYVSALFSGVRSDERNFFRSNQPPENSEVRYRVYLNLYIYVSRCCPNQILWGEIEVENVEVKVDFSWERQPSVAG